MGAYKRSLMYKGFLRRVVLVLSLELFFVFCVSFCFAEETLTITTYYPSPYGSYRELSAYRMKIGQNYSTQDVANNNLIVEGKVGIWTSMPKAKLDVTGNVIIMALCN